MALDFPSSPVEGQVYDNFYYVASKGIWKSLSSGASPSILTNPTITDAIITATAPNSTTVPLTAKGAASQSANLQEWKNSSGTTVASIGSSGVFSTSSSVYTSGVVVGTTPSDNGSTGGVGIKAPAGGSQTSAYLQFVNNAYTSQYAAIEATPTSNLKLNATYVTMPNQPYFLAFSNSTGSTTYNSNNVVAFENIRRQVGSGYNSSNSRFTAPVSGNYFLWFTAFNTGGTYRVSIRVNGSSGIFGQGGSSNSIDYHQAGVTYMAAGDYAEVRVAYDGTVIYRSDNHSEFGGMLLG